MTDLAATIPAALVVDVEPDDSAPAQRARAPWRGFEAWVEVVKPLRERLELATGRAVHFTWFLRMDPQVKEIYGDAAWAADAYGRQIEALRSAGDELALHPHAWRSQVERGRWLHDMGDPGWVEQCIAISFEAYEQAFGGACRAHRFGSRFISAAVVRQIRQLGVHVDMTVEPGARPLPSLDARKASTGSLPDARRAPRHPYRPAATDPMREDAGDGRPANAGLWMLPLSAFDPAPVLPRWRQVARRLRFFGQPLHRPAELWAPTNPGVFWGLVERSLDDLQQPYLCLAVRSDSLIRPHLAAAVNSKLDALPADALVKRLTFATATEAVDQLTAS